jgi:uncharacterized membrane protein YjjB (DUF3815 family)
MIGGERAHICAATMVVVGEVAARAAAALAVGAAGHMYVRWQGQQWEKKP